MPFGQQCANSLLKLFERIDNKVTILFDSTNPPSCWLFPAIFFSKLYIDPKKGLNVYLHKFPPPSLAAVKRINEKRISNVVVQMHCWSNQLMINYQLQGENMYIVETKEMRYLTCLLYLCQPWMAKDSPKILTIQRKIK